MQRPAAVEDLQDEEVEGALQAIVRMFGHGMSRPKVRCQPAKYKARYV
jgi:hypothetical protein